MSQSGGEEDSYGTLLARLINDGERFAKARFLLYRAIVFYRVEQMRRPVALLLGGVLVAGAAVVALFLGLVLGLSQYVGPLLAGAIIFVAGLAVAVLLLAIGWNSMPDITDLNLDDEGIPGYEPNLDEAPGS